MGVAPDVVQAYATVVGVVATIVGFVIVLIQVRQLERSVRSGTHAAIYSQAADFRAHLIAHPHLRRYFFDGAEITDDHPDHDRVVTIAELFLNHLEHIAVMADTVGRRNRTALEAFARGALERSPVMRWRLSEGRTDYSPALHRLLGATSRRPPAA